MRKSALLVLVVLHVACARGPGDLEIGDVDINPSDGDDGGASGGASTGSTSIVPGGTSTGGTTGATSSGGSSGASSGGSSGTSSGSSGTSSGGTSTGASTAGTTGGTSTGGSTGSTSGGTSTGGSTGGTSGGTSTGGTSGGTTGAECGGATITCEQASALGMLDASDETSTVMKQGTGSGWFSVELKDGNLNNTGNSRIGLRATLTVTSGTYRVTLVGDTSPGGAGRCSVADVTDTTPLSKSAIWGSYGPIAAKTRPLTVRVEHVSGPCDGTWTLKVTGNPCPAATVGFGEDSLGSCP